jgi:hypothetical protein
MSRYLAAHPDPAAVMAVLAREVFTEALLLELRFASGTVYLSNWVVPFTDTRDGHVWQGAGNLVSGSPVTGGDGDLAPVMEYTLGIPAELLSEGEAGEDGKGLIPMLMLDRPEYVGRKAILWSQIFDDTVLTPEGQSTPVGYPVAEHAGLMDRASVTFAPGVALVTLTVESLLARKAQPAWGRLTARDQARRHSDDKGLDYVPEVVATEIQWTKW